MDLTLIAVIGVASIVTVAAFSQRLGLAAPLSLVVVGVVLGFVPGVPDVDVEPELILDVVLPPLLYSAAVTMPAQDFRRNFKAISGLAVLLVVVTTAGAGVLFHLLIPDLGWAACFALGAVVSPTDAVAATSVGRKLGLPSRLLTVLEGEGLVNDASALVLLRSAVAAMAGAVSLWHVAGDFLFSVVVATIIGIVVGILNVRIRALFNETVLNTAVSFVLPFVAFVPAEEFGASGVLAVVVTGVVTGHLSPRYLRAEDRITEELNWRTVAFLLESAIFLIMGLSLEHLLDEVHESGLPAGQGLWIGLIASAFVIAARMAFVVPLVAVLKRDERKAAETLPELQRRREKLAQYEAMGSRARRHQARRVERAAADMDFLVTETLGWRGGVVLAWSGMRGAITLAAAQSLPEDTPYRAELVLIAFVVAVTTLLLQGLSLPTVISWVKVPGDDHDRLRVEYGDLLGELAESGEKALGSAAGDVRPEVVDRVRSDSLIGVKKVRDAMAPDPEHDEWREQYIELRLLTIAAEREALLDARSRGTYSSQTLGAAQRRLDLEETRLQALSEHY